MDRRVCSTKALPPRTRSERIRRASVNDFSSLVPVYVEYVSTVPNLAILVAPIFTVGIVLTSFAFFDIPMDWNDARTVVRPRMS